MSGERAASPVATLPLLVGISTVIVFAAFMLRATDGHFVPQVVDLYVVCQYAKALAEAHRSSTTSATRPRPAPRARSTPRFSRSAMRSAYGARRWWAWRS